MHLSSVPCSAGDSPRGYTSAGLAEHFAVCSGHLKLHPDCQGLPGLGDRCKSQLLPTRGPGLMAQTCSGPSRWRLWGVAAARTAGHSSRGPCPVQVGPELEIPGYGCEDHFQEMDTVEHSWECLTELISGGHTQGIVCDVGMPVIHRGVRYNCRVYLHEGKVLLIRPKLSMADDGNYRCDSREVLD